MPDFQIQQDTLKIFHLTEKTDPEQLLAVLTQMKSALQSQNQEFLKVDFSEARANSTGLLTWKQAVKSTAIKIDYVQVPTWLVDVFGFQGEIFLSDGKVTSFYAPFFSTHKNISKQFLLRVGLEVPVFQNPEDYATFNFKIKDADGEELEPDFRPEEHLIFFKYIWKHYK